MIDFDLVTIVISTGYDNGSGTRPCDEIKIIKVSGTFSSGDVFPQAGRCRETRVAGAGLFSADITDNCTDTVALMARRFDLD